MLNTIKMFLKAPIMLNGLKLKKLSDYDMGNVIRFWLNEHQVLMPSTKVLGTDH